MSTKSPVCVVIGGGPAGTEAALALAGRGAEVTLVTPAPEALGGTCLNEGCIPVKCLIESARLWHSAKNGARFGLSIEAGEVDFSTVLRSADETRARLRAGLHMRLTRAGVKILHGMAAFDSSSSVVVRAESGDNRLEFDRCLVAAGSVVKPLAVFPLVPGKSVSSSELLRHPKLPSSLIIIGAGAIGCEFASLYSLFGARVTLLEAREEILPGEDQEAGRTLRREMTKMGVDVRAGVMVKSLETLSEGVRAVVIENGAETVVEAEIALIAVGRLPATATLGLEHAGIFVDARGFIPVDSKGETRVAGIYAAGDVVDTPAYAHNAAREGIRAALAMLGQADPLEGGGRFTPRVVFTEPEVAGAGETEESLKARGVQYNVGKAFFRANGKAVLKRHEAGLVKWLVEKESGRPLGMVMVGPQVSELLSSAMVALESGLTASQFCRAMAAHPTLSETLTEALMAAVH